MNIRKHLDALEAHRRIAHPAGGEGRKVTALFSRGVDMLQGTATEAETLSWMQAVRTVTATTTTWK